MNYRDLQTISHLSQQILTEAAYEEHNVMNRWPYASPYLQEARDGYGGDEKFKQDTDAASFRPGKDVPKVKKFGRISRSVPYGIGAHANRTASRVSTIVGDDPGAPRSQKMTTRSKMVKKNGKWQKVKEELELWVNSLLDEGYDLSDYTWDDMYEIYLDEAAKRIPKKVRGAKDPNEYMAGRSPAGKRISGDERTGPVYYTRGSGRSTMDPPTQPNQRPKNTPSLSSSERKYHQYNKSESKRMTAAGYNKVGGRRGLPESYDNFDIILEYLISEGYADTDDAALAIMSNMSEYWFNSIVEQSVDSQGNRSHDLFTGASNPSYNSSNGTTTSKKPLPKKQPQPQPPMRDQPLF